MEPDILAKISFSFICKVPISEEYSDQEYGWVPLSWLVLRHQQFYPSLLCTIIVKVNSIILPGPKND